MLLQRPLLQWLSLLQLPRAVLLLLSLLLNTPLSLQRLWSVSPLLPIVAVVPVVVDAVGIVEVLQAD
jgi:hypothetical protein